MQEMTHKSFTQKLCDFSDTYRYVSDDLNRNYSVIDWLSLKYLYYSLQLYKHQYNINNNLSLMVLSSMITDYHNNILSATWLKSLYKSFYIV